MFKKISTLIATGLAAMTCTVGLATATSTGTASAASCMRTVTVAGVNSIGYRPASVSQSTTDYVRAAPLATICINYTKAGGFYASSATCGTSTARLNASATLTLRNYSSYVQHAEARSVACTTSVDWLWNRPYPIPNQCVQLSATALWTISSNGSVTLSGNLATAKQFTTQPGC